MLLQGQTSGILWQGAAESASITAEVPARLTVDGTVMDLLVLEPRGSDGSAEGVEPTTWEDEVPYSPEEATVEGYSSDTEPLCIRLRDHTPPMERQVSL